MIESDQDRLAMLMGFDEETWIDHVKTFFPSLSPMERHKLAETFYLLCRK